MKHFALLALLFMYANLLLSQQAESTPPVIFIYDASGSMWGKIGNDTKMNIASEVLSNTVEGMPKGQQLGLVAYGHRKKGDCKDVEYLVNAKNEDKQMLIDAIKAIKPLGKTPLAYSANLVIEQLKKSGEPTTVILITDGIESCDGDICKVVTKAKEEGIIFKLHIVGFGLKESETKQLRCAAQAGGGQYHDAKDSESLSDVLNEATNATVDKPPYNFSLFAVKNDVPIDAYVTAIDKSSGKKISAARTYQDTAKSYIPPGTYDLHIKPLESSDVSEQVIYNVEITDDSIIHKTLSFDSGKLLVDVHNNGEGWDATVKIFNAATNKEAARGRTYGRVKEFDLNAGEYYVIVEPLDIKGVDLERKSKTITITATEKTTQTENYSTGVVKIGAKNSNGELLDFIVKIKDANTGAHVESRRTYTSASSNPKAFTLQTGTYKATLNGVGKNKGQTKTVEFTVDAESDNEMIYTFK